MNDFIFVSKKLNNDLRISFSFIDKVDAIIKFFDDFSYLTSILFVRND